MQYLGQLGSGVYGRIQSYWNQPTEANEVEPRAVTAMESANNRCLPSDDVLRRASIEAFNRFKDVWEFDDFWKRGNTCDACLSFADALHTRWPDDPEVVEICQSIQEMLKTNVGFFNDHNVDDKWLDDNGWWGLTGCNGYVLLKKLKNEELANQYLAISTKHCWERMKAFAYDTSDDAKPVPYGCRNNGVENRNLGVKNTVVNALFFLLSTRLYRLYIEEGRPESDSEPFLEMAYNQWVWFSSWFKLTDYGYLKPFKGDPIAALVQERPLAKDSHYQDTSHPDWVQGWTWSGDQGLILRALLDLIAIKEKLAEYYNRTHKDKIFDGEGFDTSVKAIIHSIVLGVKKGLIGESDSIFREAPCVQSFNQYSSDYLAGRGILTRYLGVSEIKSLTGIDFSVNIAKTLEALLAKKDGKTNQFSIQITEEADDLEYVKQFDDLWGAADKSTKWNIPPSIIVDGVSQSIGLDFLGKALLE